MEKKNRPALALHCKKNAAFARSSLAAPPAPSTPFSGALRASFHGGLAAAFVRRAAWSPARPASFGA